MKTVTWNIEKLERFKKAYKLAVLNKDESFIFETDNYVVAYAKYLIEYLEDIL